MKQNKLELDLLTNGLDFISESINSSSKSESNILQIKYAILHLSAGVELIFKQKLVLEHWSFLFENINSAKKTEISKGNFVSVNSKTCLVRLKNLCGVNFSEKDIITLENLRRQRNKIEHFAVNENVEALKSILSKVLLILVEFIDKEINNLAWSKVQVELYKKIRIDSAAFEKFVNLKLATLKETLKQQEFVTRCEHCFQDTVCFDSEVLTLNCLFCNQTNDSNVINCPECLEFSFFIDGWEVELHCLNCKYSDTPEKIATEYYENVKGHSFHQAFLDGDYSVKTQCLSCGIDSLIDLDDRFLCLSCHESWSSDNVQECTNCGELYSKKSEEDIFLNCENCLENRMAYMK